jgi:hypothetical protein
VIAGNFFIRCEPVRFLGRTLLHGVQNVSDMEVALSTTHAAFIRVSCCGYDVTQNRIE